VEFSHLAPSAVGRTVTCEAILLEVDGRRLIFTVALTDTDTLVAEGKVERLIVDRHRFVEKANAIR
jgi:predicted thioesterase